MQKEINIGSLIKLKKIAEEIAASSKIGDVITLTGDLGTGKTSFARYFINSFFKEEQEILSPTFPLVQLYKTSRGTIWHYDLYRLENENELEELGLDEALNDGIVILEWPEIAINQLPRDRVDIELKFNTDNTRKMKINFIGLLSNDKFKNHSTKEFPKKLRDK
jgi:tRNA threonylcarbamoyl adenosine modification protein YjeE